MLPIIDFNKEDSSHQSKSKEGSSDQSRSKDESSGDLHFKNMFDRDSKKQPKPEVTADTPMSDIL